MTSIDRSKAAAQGKEAVRIIEEGGYQTSTNTRVELAERIASAVARSRDYAPGDAVGASTLPRGAHATRLSVVNDTSLAAARAFAKAGAVPLVLNFASAKNPGGGFLSGARAQEESLARSSALHACLMKSRMYAHHRALSDCMYTSWAIHSPDVPVFRDDVTGALLDEPYAAAFLTAPAPNAKVVLERDASRADEVVRVVNERVARVLAICAAHGHTHLVLGAWGCGVFGNDPTVMAGAFRRELDGAYAGVFEAVTFAVLDWSDEKRFIRPFERAFAA
jgi:uncharacterized protein (TIGR02452 family)